MRIVTKKVNLPAVVENVEKLELEDMQSLVGGYIEHLDCGGLDLWLNEEGKLHGLAPNLVAFYGKEARDVIVGDVFFTAHDNDGETIGLTDEEIDNVFKRLGSMMIMHDGDGELVLAQSIEMK